LKREVEAPPPRHQRRACFCFVALFVILLCSLCSVEGLVLPALMQNTFSSFLAFAFRKRCGATQTSGSIGGCRRTHRHFVTLSYPPQPSRTPFLRISFYFCVHFVGRVDVLVLARRFGFELFWLLDNEEGSWQSWLCCVFDRRLTSLYI